MKNISKNNLIKSDKDLIELALKIRENAYCPYSGYKVGAALIDSAGNIHTGCNIESADFTLTSHAEMVAVDSMVKSGCREIRKIAVALKGMGEKPPSVCGLCRQKIAEFNKNGDCEIIIANLDENNNTLNITSYFLNELLPFAFSNEFIKS